MADTPRTWRDVTGWLDDRLLDAVVSAVTVSAAAERRRLQRAGWAYLDPEQPSPPPLADLDATADRVIDQAATQLTAVGGAAGLGGLAGIPPEIAATLVGLVRLAQRLAVVYGFDPETDRGRLATWQALGSGLDVELPQQGPTALRVSELPGLLSGARSEASASAIVSQALTRESIKLLLKRFGRLLPIYAVGIGAAGARGRTLAAGARMRGTLRRLAETTSLAGADIVDAVELG